jgi:hypothetical protein
MDRFGISGLREGLWEGGRERTNKIKELKPKQVKNTPNPTTLPHPLSFFLFSFFLPPLHNVFSHSPSHAPAAAAS